MHIRDDNCLLMKKRRDKKKLQCFTFENKFKRGIRGTTFAEIVCQ